VAKVKEELDEVERATGNAQRGAIGGGGRRSPIRGRQLRRKLAIDPRAALERANDKFRRRFEAMEQLAEQRGVAIGRAGLDELDKLWDEVKTQSL